MCMSYEQFVSYAVDLKNHSDSIDDDWNLCEHLNPMNGSVIKYLVKKEIQKINKSSLSSNDSKFHVNEDNIYPVVCEYHVLYNSSYACPDIFFNKWYTDGKLLSLEHIWSLVHTHFKQNLFTDKWNALTQEEHPLKNTPFFRVHPCQNTHILEILGFSSNNTFKLNPIVSWLSTISPLIGLEIHLSYGQKNSNVVI